MRLFTALWPSEQAIRDLDAVVSGLRPERLAAATDGLRGFRLVPAVRWHLTLCFHGDNADAQRLGQRLQRRLPRLLREHPEPPRIRLAGTGVFRSTLWVGAEPAGEPDAACLRALARAAGADTDAFRAHLTIGRWSGGRVARGGLRSLLASYVGPWWTVREVALVRSDQVEGAPEYRTVHRVPLDLGRRGPCQQG